jgi:hypothetical protein
MAKKDRYKTKAERARTAHHEAGHAVAALFSGIQIRHVTIKADLSKDYIGCTRVHLPRWMEDGYEILPYTLAGPIADFIYRGRTAVGALQLSSALKELPLVRITADGKIDGLLPRLGSDDFAEAKRILALAHEQNHAIRSDDFAESKRILALAHEQNHAICHMRRRSEIEDLIDVIVATARRLAAPERWAAVSAVAKELLAYETVQGDRVDEIVTAKRQPAHIDTSWALPMLESLQSGKLAK